MKKSLLKIVQDVLNELDSDPVNDINDTVESLQIAQIAENCYYEMLANRTWPHLKKLVQLDHAGDLTKPNYLKLPENLKEMSEFRYQTQKSTDTKQVITEIKYMYPDEFLSFISGRNSDNSNVDVIQDFSGVSLFIFNDQAPKYWTSFDDVYLVTDAYDSAVDTSLQKSKSQALAQIIPAWQYDNDFIPDFPIDAFPAFVEEVKSTSSYKLKQMADQKSEQKASRQNRWLSRKAWRAHGGVRYQDYGRKSRR